MKIKKQSFLLQDLVPDFYQLRKHSLRKCYPLLINQQFNTLLKKQWHLELRTSSLLQAKANVPLKTILILRLSLKQNLLKKGKIDLLNKVRYSANLANIHYVRQKEPLGLGHAIWCARNFIGNEPFAVLLGDDIVQSKTPCLKQLINVYDETGSSVVGVQAVPWNETQRYGIIDPGTQGKSDTKSETW